MLLWTETGKNPHRSFLFFLSFFFFLIRRNTWSWVNHAAAAAKSLQSCPTLCDPIDGSPRGSPVPGILQARTLEWVAISFSNAGKCRVKVKSLSRVQLFATPWTVAYQAPPSMGVFQARVPERVAISYSISRVRILLTKYLINNFYFSSEDVVVLFCFKNKAKP